MPATTTTTIRRDLYAVKEWQERHWVFVLITKDKKAAENYAKVLGFRKFKKPKIVHPSQFTVDCYVLVGNTID